MSAINILIRTEQAENRFGPYVAEMLRSEGIGDLDIVGADVREGWPELAADVVLLTRCHLRVAEVDRLLTYVRQGGVLIAFQPPWRLCEAVGIAPTYRATLCAYLLPDGDHPATAFGIEYATVRVEGELGESVSVVFRLEGPCREPSEPVGQLDRRRTGRKG